MHWRHQHVCVCVCVCVCAFWYSLPWIYTLKMTFCMVHGGVCKVTTFRAPTLSLRAHSAGSIYIFNLAHDSPLRVIRVKISLLGHFYTSRKLCTTCNMYKRQRLIEARKVSIIGITWNSWWLSKNWLNRKLWVFIIRTFGIQKGVWPFCACRCVVKPYLVIYAAMLFMFSVCTSPLPIKATSLLRPSSLSPLMAADSVIVIN